MLLHDVFAFHATARPDLVFAVDGDRTVTYGESLDVARRLAGALVRSGIGPGDRFGVIGPNSFEHAIVYYGASMVGAVPVPCNPRLAPAEVAFVLAAAIAFADNAIADQENELLNSFAELLGLDEARANELLDAMETDLRQASDKAAEAAGGEGG